MRVLATPMLAPAVSPPMGNRLLASLSDADAALLLPALRCVSFDLGRVLTEPQEIIENVYFPITGVISLLAVMKDGKAVETATIGHEGAVGLMAGLGLDVTLTRAVAQTPVHAARIEAVELQRLVQQSATLQERFIRYNETLLKHVQITAGCNALHPIPARISRWILQSSEQLDDEVIPLTQELLSEMFGVRRSSVTEAVRKLEQAGLLQPSRGKIRILNRRKLEAASCECYAMLRQLHGMELS